MHNTPMVEVDEAELRELRDLDCRHLVDFFDQLLAFSDRKKKAITITKRSGGDDLHREFISILRDGRISCSSRGPIKVLTRGRALEIVRARNLHDPLGKLFYDLLSLAYGQLVLTNANSVLIAYRQ